MKIHSAKQDLSVFSPKAIVICATGVQWGKGLDLDELVLTPEGYKKAGAIRVGDTLFDRMGEPTKVIGVFPQGVRPCFEITFTDRKTLITDEEHQHVIKHRSGRPEHVRTTKYLYENSFLWSKKDRKISSRPQIPSISNPIKIPNRDLLISPYILGALLGDGGLSSSSICFASSDQEVIDRISRELPREMKITKADGKYDYRLVRNETAGPNQFINELRYIGLMGHKADIKFIPDSYKFSGPEQRLDLLRGLMDTDGGIQNRGDKDKADRQIEFVSISKQLAEDVIWLVESLGGKAWCNIKKNPKYTYKGEKKTGQTAYRVNIISPLINPFYLPRKAEKYFKHDNTPNKSIKGIVPVSPRETVCFSVDSPTETYIARGQVVTHNTKSLALRMKIKMHTFTAHDDNFLITSPTFRIFKQSTLPPFLGLMKGLGRYNKADECFQMYGGGTCWFRTGMNPDSVVGITNIRACGCDEAGLYSLYFWENIQGRAAFCKAPIHIVTSPYSQNWLFKDYIRPKLKDPNALPDVELIQATSKENPYFPADKYDELRKTMDPRRFNMMFGGEFNKKEGIVYDCFDDEFNIADLFEFPKDTKFFGGIDWGYTDPFVLVIHAVLPNGLRFQVSETYKAGLTIDKITDICKQKKAVFGVERFYAGPDRPDYISYLCRHDCPTVGAENGIRIGIDIVYEQIKTRRFKFIRGTSPHSLDEIEVYHYPNPKDLKPDQDGKDQNPVGQNEHCLDAIRYCVISTERANIKKTPSVPSEFKKVRTQADRIKRLLERKEAKAI